MFKCLCLTSISTYLESKIWVSGTTQELKELKKKAIEEYLAKQAEEDLKKKAVEEYLAKQAAEEAEKSAEDNTEN